MFSANFKKICCSFAENEIFEKSKISVKMADVMLNAHLYQCTKNDKGVAQDCLMNLYGCKFCTLHCINHS